MQQLSHPSVSVSLTPGAEIKPPQLYPNVHFKQIIKWRMDNTVGLANLSSQLQKLRRTGLRVSYLLLLDMDVAEYQCSTRHIQKIVDDPYTSVILYNMNRGVPAFLLEKVGHIIEGGARVSTTFSVDDLPVRKLAIYTAQKLAPYLEVLQLVADEHLTRDVIRSRYRRAVLVAHPDKGGTQAEFERITQAYDVLMGWVAESCSVKSNNVS